MVRGKSTLEEAMAALVPATARYRSPAIQSTPCRAADLARPHRYLPQGQEMQLP